MLFRIQILSAVLLLLLLTGATSFSRLAHAAESQDTWGAEQGKNLDHAQEVASAKLLDVANWIDSFFDDDRAVEEENTTRATIKLSLGYSRNDDFEIKPRFDWRLKLPKLSNRVQLFISASEDEDFDVDSEPISARPVHEDADNSELTAGLKWFLKESEKYNFSFDTGVSWDYLFAGVRYRSIQEYGRWQGRLTNRLRYYTDDGLENKLTYDLERSLTTKTMLRTTTSINWYEDGNGFPHSQSFRLYQVLSKFQALSYDLGIYLDTEPSYQVADLQFSVKYRQRFYRDWLTLEIAPRITFPENHDYEANPGIVFKLEASIGYRPGEAGYDKIFL